MAILQTKNQQGFSVMELLVVVGIFSIVGGSLFTLLITSQTLFPLLSTRQRLIYETSRALNYTAELLTQMNGNINQFDIEDILVNGADSGNDRIRFRVPFVQNNQVQIDNNGNIIWGAFDAAGVYLAGGHLVIGYVEGAGLVLEEYDDGDQLRDIRVLSEYISGVQFNYAKGRIEISMQAERVDRQGRSISVTFSTQVAPRN